MSQPTTPAASNGVAPSDAALDGTSRAAAHDAARQAHVIATQLRDRPGGGAPRTRPHVVIVGGGFAGYHAARDLKNVDVDVTLLDRTNHFLFQPLLYQVATAVLAPTDITIPIRYLLRKHANVEVLMADVREIDVNARTVYLDDERTPLEYDYLVLAAGARHSYFGHDEWEHDAPGLKTIADAYEIRRRFLLAFEEAEKEPDPAKRAEWLTFVVIGGGPTGSELAGMIPATADTFRKDFRHIDTAMTRVLLLEGSPRVLAAYPEELSAKAKHELEELGVAVRTGAHVTKVTDEAVYVGDERIPTRTVFWGAGNAATPLGKQLGVQVDKAGRVPVQPDLSVAGRPEVFVVGDAAAYVDRGKPVPGVAQGAIQMGRHAAHNIRASVQGKARTTFKYWNKGNLATIGRHKGVADLGPHLRFAGYFAWLLWVFVHIMYLAGFRNRLSVLIQWGYSYLTYHRGARLISGQMARRGSTATPSEGPAKDGSRSGSVSRAMASRLRASSLPVNR